MVRRLNIMKIFITERERSVIWATKGMKIITNLSTFHILTHLILTMM